VKEAEDDTGQAERKRGLMSVVVRIPAPLRSKAGGRRQIELEAHRFEVLLDEMEAAYPGITGRLRREDGTLRRTLNIYVNRQNIRFLQGLDTPLKDGDEVSIVPAIAGGG
jgi:molybdopterin synthase sulfur carrier subunit